MKAIKVLIAPDKFRPKLSAQQVCQIISEELPKKYQSKNIPLADGGQGSLQSIQKSVQSQKKYVIVHNPLFTKMRSYYLLNKKQNTAYIEMAKASGVMLLQNNQRNPLKTTTFGTGQLIKDAVAEGCKNIYLLIGGSATNEGGIGAACALGYKFLNHSGEEVKPIGENLEKISKIISPKSQNGLDFHQINIKISTDVNNQLIGPSGATYVFGRQKGANQQALKILERGMINLSKKIHEHFKIDISQTPGGGAAGGLGAGCIAFFGGQITSGIETISKIVNLQEHIKGSDIIITGQGKLDNQSLQGKVIKGTIDLAKKYNKKTIIFCGKSQVSAKQLGKKSNITIIENQREGMTDQYSISNAENLLRRSVRQYFYQ